MYVVIFRAKTKALDAEYSATASVLRQLALEQFHCVEFIAVTEGEQEIALSYWHKLEDIQAWKAHGTHVLAQQRGRTDWYETYQVQIAEIQREYRFP
ncbi:antibiotic biosynthesis monooxygenase family protein [Parvibium lacunae]|uniref:Antibiotic biosynthesis monooxygenase n=1 Tax=Parvibium lacunae TaxID=1888893 RepID=A0A368L1W2_9BURK|nr:antibiotic biosynthesis monooxygenase [Parvibium lacunae]RCS57545.1 antibiotic biosynthesis monooxygenase [Parvibium lacunae]